MANTVQIIVSVQDRASSALSGITGALGNMASVAGGIIAADVIGRIGEGFATAARSGFDFNRNVQNLSATLNAYTKSQEISNQMLAWANEEAAKTPFAYEDIGSAITSLLPIANQLDMNYQDLIKDAEILAASNPMEGMTGAAFALKEALSGDFTSIIERFNLPRQMINQLKEEGVPNIEIVRQAMQSMGMDMDLVSNLSATFDGRMSTLKDTFVNLAGTFTQPIFDFLSEQIFGLQGTLDENMPIIEERMRNAGQMVADTFQTIKEAWSGEWVDSDVIQPLHRLAGTITLNVKAAWDGLIAAIQTAQGVWQMIQEEWNELNKIGDSWNRLMEAGQGLWNTLIGAVQTVGGLLGFAAEKGDAHNKAMKDASPLATTLISLFDGMAKAISLAAIGINLAVVGLQQLTTWANNAAGAWQNLSNTVAGGIQGASDAAAGAVQGGADQVFGPPPPKGTGSTIKGMIVGRGMAGAPVVMNVYSQIDYEEAAYRIARIMQDNR